MKTSLVDSVVTSALWKDIEGRLGFILIQKNVLTLNLKENDVQSIYFWHYRQAPKWTEFYWLKNDKTEYDNRLCFIPRKVPQSSMVMLNYLASYSPCHSIQFNDIDLFIGTPNCVLWKYTFKFTYLFNKKNQPSAFSFRTSTTGSEYRVAFLAGKKDLQCRNCK